MIDPVKRRARVERARRSLWRGYVSCVGIAVAALILIIGGWAISQGFLVLALDAMMLVCLVVTRRSLDRELNKPISG